MSLDFRPRQLIGILGTQTEVGKTYVAAQWLTSLRQAGRKVAARKPVQSYDASDLETDAVRLAAATGENVQEVCAAYRSYPLAVAPPMAADSLQRGRIAMKEVAAEIRWSADVEIGVIETVGGPLSPLAHDGDSIDLLRHVAVDRVLLVADAGLGTLNAVRLCLQCIRPMPAIVYLNRFDVGNSLHVDNRAWLTDRYGVNAVVEIGALMQWTGAS